MVNTAKEGNFNALIVQVRKQADAYSDISNDDSYHYLNCSAGLGCIHTDPRFVNPTAGDYHLQIPTSGDTPIDKGHDFGDLPYNKVPTTDIEGSPRVDVSGVSNGTGGLTDMGAYEAQEQ